MSVRMYIYAHIKSIPADDYIEHNYNSLTVHAPTA